MEAPEASKKKGRPIRRAASSTHWENRCGFRDSVAMKRSLDEWRLVDDAWRYFWAKRKFDPPPAVSSRFVGVFNLPHRPLDSWRDMTFGKGSPRRRWRPREEDEWDFTGHEE